MQKIKHWVLPLLFSLALLSLCATAQESGIDVLHDQEAGIEKIKLVEMTIKKDGLVSVSEELIVRRGDIVRRIVPGRVDDLVVLDSRGSSIPVYESSPEDERQLLGFFLDESGKPDESVWIRYSIRNITVRSGGVWSMDYSSFYTPRSTIIKLHFPEDVQILAIEPKDVYRTKVKPFEMWLFPQEDFLYFNCRYRFKEEPVDTSDSGSLLLPLGIALVVSFLAFSVWILLKRRPAGAKASGSGKSMEANETEVSVDSEPQGAEKRSVKETKGRAVKDSVLKMLDVNEARIVKMLEEAEGEITQAYVYKSTQIPKTSLSDIIRRLVKRNLIECKKEGRTNWLRLKDWVFE